MPATAISAGASAASALAATNAVSTQQVTLCQQHMQGYTNNTTSVEEKQTYAQCVELTYPSYYPSYPSNGVVILGLVMCVVSAIAVGRRSYKLHNDWTFAILGGVTIFLLALAVFVATILLYSMVP